MNLHGKMEFRTEERKIQKLDTFCAGITQLDSDQTQLPAISTPAEPQHEILFYQALELPPSQRGHFLDGACPADGKLRREVDELLRAHDDATQFLPEEGLAAPELEREIGRIKPEQTGDRLGPYNLLEQIGEGGFGTVWVAEQEKPIRRRVALKIIKLGMDTKEVIARFEQERQALAMMDHPNIARVLDAGASPSGRPFFVMELVRGIKITTYCDQAHLPTSERLRIFIAVCHAVQHAHQKGIIHRDLKPSNILVTLHDGVPVPKVIDFGVAKATQQQRLTDLAKDIQRHLVSEPIQARPATQFYRFRRFAIKLRPDMADYVLAKADLLQSQLRFAEAGPLYHAALQLSPGSVRAQANADLCDTLAVEAAVQPKLSRESLSLLFAAMVKEGRSPAQALRIGRLVGDEKKVLLDYWLERLKDLPTTPDHPLRSLLSVTESGRLELDPGYTYVGDITPLRGMPLEYLTLSGCPNLSDLTPLQGMPLETLNLGQMELEGDQMLPACKVRDLAPFRGLPLKHLNLRGTPVTDLAPLSGMPLEFLQLRQTRVWDLSPLRGMPLKELHIEDTAVTDLSPLRGLPLQVLGCNGIPALDFAALAEMATLETLVLSGTGVGDLSFLRKLPLKTLFINTCEKVRGLKVLSEIQSLEVLALPSALSKFPLEELTAVEALRPHPHLQQIQLGTGTRGTQYSLTPKLSFWAEFDQVLRTRKALAQVAGGTPDCNRLPDRTWSASFAVNQAGISRRSGVLRSQSWICNLPSL